MKNLKLTVAMIFLLSLTSSAQEPDFGITVGTVYVDSGVTDVWVPVYLTSIDTFCFLNSPLSWSPLNSGIYPVDVIPVMVPPCNLINDSIYIDEGLIEIGGGYCDSGSSQLLVHIRFAIEPDASPQILTLSAGNSPRNGGPLFGFCDGLTSVVPIFTPGYIFYGMPNSANDGSLATPIKFSIAPIYPNPFSGGTNLNYELEEGQHVKLEIFNINGQLIDILVDSFQEKGQHGIYWNGRGAGFENLPSGIYLYRLSNGKKAIVKKFTLLR